MSKTRVNLENLLVGKCVLHIGNHPSIEIDVPRVEGPTSRLNQEFIDHALASAGKQRAEIEKMADVGWEDWLEEFRALLAGKNM